VVSEEPPFLNASKAWILLRCHRRWRLESDVSSESRMWDLGVVMDTNIGTIAHKAIEEWVDSGAWKAGNAGDLLARLFEGKAPTDPTSIGHVRRLSALLAFRAQALVTVLAESSKKPGTEVSLQDDSRRVRGQLDLVTYTEQQVHVVDVKTGAGLGAANALPLSVECQMAIYAFLAAGEWHAEVQLSVFSTESGFRALPMELVEATSRVDQLISERTVASASKPDAHASADVCTWCHFRDDCDAHWSAVDAGFITDAVSGWVIHVSDSDAGIGSVVFESSSGTQVLSGVSRSLAESVAVGQFVMFFRVRRDPRGNSDLWHATRKTGMKVRMDRG